MILIYIFIDIKLTNNLSNINVAKIKNKNDFSDKKFAIIERRCPNCGLFSFFLNSLACIHNFLNQGYIPIIDLKSFPNVINGFNTSKDNYWELFFDQPFGYTLDEVLKNGKNITRIICSECRPYLSMRDMPFDIVTKNYWHDFQVKYLPVKQEIIDLANKFRRKLFKNSMKVLGVLTRGTDYISRKPTLHCIPPKITDLIHDVKEMDSKYLYDYIFFTTEDDNIREIFIKSFPNKVKQIKPGIKINYNYNGKDFLGYNKKISGNIEYI